MNRVVVTNPFIGLTHMQVCTVADATDEEILRVCNRENMAGISNGLTTVHREDTGDPNEFGFTPGPVVCADDPDRLHILVSC